MAAGVSCAIAATCAACHHLSMTDTCLPQRQECAWRSQHSPYANVAVSPTGHQAASTWRKRDACCGSTQAPVLSHHLEGCQAPELDTPVCSPCCDKLFPAGHACCRPVVGAYYSVHRIRLIDVPECKAAVIGCRHDAHLRQPSHRVKQRPCCCVHTVSTTQQLVPLKECLLHVRAVQRNTMLTGFHKSTQVAQKH
jgi:hypothetical protein